MKSKKFGYIDPEHIKFLSNIKNRHNRKNALESADKPQINLVRNCCANLVQSKFTDINGKHKKQLTKYKNLYRKLADTSYQPANINKVLSQNGEGIAAWHR